MLTSVSGVLTNLYFFKISMRVILASMRANLIPMQLRGPQPKGMWHTCSRALCLLLRSEPEEERKDGGRTREEGWRKTVPFWVKFLWFWPEFWIVLKELDGDMNSCSLGNGDCIDLSGVLSKM